MFSTSDRHFVFLAESPLESNRSPPSNLDHQGVRPALARGVCSKLPPVNGGTRSGGGLNDYIF